MENFVFSVKSSGVSRPPPSKPSDSGNLHLDPSRVEDMHMENQVSFRDKVLETSNRIRYVKKLTSLHVIWSG